MDPKTPVPTTPPIPVPEVTPPPVSPQTQTPITTPISEPIAPSAPTTSSIPKPKSKVLNILITVLMILILSATAVVAYIKVKGNQTIPTPTPFSSTPVATATPDPTADWKTFPVDPKYLYSFKYPADYVTGQHLTGSGFALSSQELGGKGLVIDFNPTETKPDLKIYAEQRHQAMQNVGAQSDIKEITFSGLPAMFFQGTGERFGETYIIKLTSGYVLEIEVLYPSPNSTQEYKPLADQILSTFKFTNTTMQPVSGSMIGYIKSISVASNTYTLAIDLIDSIDGDPVIIVNKSTAVVNLTADDSTNVTLATYEHGDDGNFKNTKLSIAEFLNIYNSNQMVKSRPYHLQITDGKITQIAEYYLP